MVEVDIGKNFTFLQGVGPTYNILGYGTGINFNSQLIGDLYEQFTYLGGIRFYPAQKDHKNFMKRGFGGGYFGLHYAVNFDQLVKPGAYKSQNQFQLFVDDLNCVGFLMGYQAGIGKHFYANANVGFGINTFLYGGAGPLASFDCGWRFWEPSFKS